MNGLNDAFYFVIDKIITMQAFFTGTAWAIGRVALTISVVSAAVNYGLTGTGLKENIIKMLKAVVFFVIVMAAYPKIVSWITTTTFNLAQNAAYDQDMQNSMNRARATIISAANDTNNAGGDKSKDTYAKTVLTSDTVNKDPASFFGNMLGERTAGEITYTTVAPAAALEAILLVAGECVKRGSEGEPKLHIGPVEFPNLGTLFIGLLCGFCVIFTGIFAVLEYLIAYLEFMLVAAVGIILFPLSLWEGSKFMAEKFISAMIGFFIKLLLCSVCIFLMIWGYLSLAALFTQKPFTADVDQVLMILFTCLLFFYICKSAPGLAQGLLTGAPSLSATGAISAVAGAT
jgi:hypothetical protein